MKKILASILCTALVVSMAACGKTTGGDTADTGKSESTLRSLNLATAAMGGNIYPIGVGISEILGKELPDVEIQVEVTGGTLENAGLVNEGDCEVGFGNKDMFQFAYEGTEPYDTPHENLRGWFNGLAGGVVHYCVLESSGINCLEDLIGKNIAVGPQGNSTALFLEKVLTTMGYSWDDINPSYLSFSEGMQALADGRVDMALAAAYPPVSAIQELQASGKAFKILPFEKDFRDKFLEKYPYYTEATIDADIYGLSEDVETVSTQNIAIINADLSEEAVYEMTKAVFENLDSLKAAAVSSQTVTLENAPNTGIPLHPGAEKYFREMGVMD